MLYYVSARNNKSRAYARIAVNQKEWAEAIKVINLFQESWRRSGIISRANILDLWKRCVLVAASLADLSKGLNVAV